MCGLQFEKRHVFKANYAFGSLELSLSKVKDRKYTKIEVIGD